MREQGYYWVKSHEEWIVAFFYYVEGQLDEKSGWWSLPGSDVDLKDSALQEINENRIIR